MASSLGLGCGFTSNFVGTEKLALKSSSLVSSATSLCFTSRLAALPLAGRTTAGGTLMCAVESKPTRKPRGIMKPRRITPAMQELLGVPEIARTQALKLIWAHIKQNNLQDPQNKKIILCDEKLKKVFGGKDQVGFLEISGLIGPHFL